MVAYEGWQKSALVKIPERNPLFLQNAAELVQMTMVHVCQQFTVAPGLGLRPHSRGGCIIVTGFRVRAVKQFHAVNRKCNRLRVSILVSRQFTLQPKDIFSNSR